MQRKCNFEQNRRRSAHRVLPRLSSRGNLICTQDCRTAVPLTLYCPKSCFVNVLVQSFGVTEADCQILGSRSPALPQYPMYTIFLVTAKPDFCLEEEGAVFFFFEWWYHQEEQWVWGSLTLSYWSWWNLNAWSFECSVWGKDQLLPVPQKNGSFTSRGVKNTSSIFFIYHNLI